MGYGNPHPQSTLIYRIQMKSPKYPFLHQSNQPTSPSFNPSKTTLLTTKPLNSIHPKKQPLFNFTMIAKESTLTLKPSSRRSRTKLRKPKFLRLHLISATAPPSPSPPMPPTTTTHHHDHHKQLINLFPLHPENINLVDDDDQQDHNMACIFSSDGAATTLTGILNEEEEEYTDNPSPSSVNYADEEVELVRTAMRRNKDDHHDLKWVCYSEVVEERKKKKKKVMNIIRGLSASSSSSTSSYHHHHDHHSGNDHDHDDEDHRRKLVLKLDYEKIMDSWVNKGPFCIRNNNPDIQTVPELQDDDLFLPFSTTTHLNGLTHCERENGGNEGSWAVPEMTAIENNDMGGGDDTMQVDGSTMIHRREASVQRYKEKRRNRLFAKTIRYEVRKLNAEKRPRIKGRFVKSN